MTESKDKATQAPPATEEPNGKESAKAKAAEPQMALTDHLDLGPGVVVTPGYEVPARPEATGGVQFSDRRVIVRENPEHAARAAHERLTAEPDDVPIQGQKARTGAAPDTK